MDDALRQGLEQCAVPVFRHGQLRRQRLLAAPVPDLRGDVGGEQQHSGHGAVGAAHRLVDEVDEYLFGLVTVAAEPQPGLVAAEWLAGLHDLAEQVEAPLAAQFRECCAHGQADHITAADQLPVLAVGEHDDQVGPGQVGHCGGQAGQHLVHRGQPAAGAPT